VVVTLIVLTSAPHRLLRDKDSRVKSRAFFVLLLLPFWSASHPGLGWMIIPGKRILSTFMLSMGLWKDGELLYNDVVIIMGSSSRTTAQCKPAIRSREQSQE